MPFSKVRYPMKCIVSLNILLTLLFLSCPQANGQTPKDPSAEFISKVIADFRTRDSFLRASAFLQFVRDHKRLVKINDAPFEMSPNTAGLCIASKSSIEVHGERFCDVYVTQNAKEIMRSDQYAKTDFVTRTSLKPPIK